MLKLKSVAFVPPSATPAMCSAPVPELVSVMTCAPALAPCVTVPKETLFGVSFKTGVPGGAAVAMPVSGND